MHVFHRRVNRASNAKRDLRTLTLTTGAVVREEKLFQSQTDPRRKGAFPSQTTTANRVRKQVPRDRHFTKL